jgi:MarR-like DNA-binding transcriptional regulator SgrR of sgrS sRNA
MKDLSYFRMRAHLYQREINQQVSFKLSELEKVWYCTRRNVKRKLNKFEDEHLLIYHPGKGRGNPSTITFFKSFIEELSDEIQIHIKNEQLDEIMHLLQLPLPKQWIAKFSLEVQNILGLQSPTQNKDVLRTIIARDITTLDPLYSAITFECYLINQLGDPLVTYNPQQDIIEPHLAHSWESIDNGKAWVFHLRKGVRFHHQKILTSEDVKYTLERFKNNTSPYQWLVKDITQIECPSSSMIFIKLRKPNPFFIRYVSAVNLAILPSDIPFDEKQWIGTGPFMLKERSDTKLILEAFDQHFRERPLLDEVQFWRVPVEAAKKISFEVDNEVHSKASIQLKEIESGFRFLAFNFKSSQAVKDLSFRKAIYHLLDMKKVWKDLRRKHLVEASSFFPRKSKPVPKDYAKVSELIAKSNYKGEKLKLYTLNRLKAMEEADWFVKEAEKIGIFFETVYFDLNEMFDERIDHEADIIFLGEVATLDEHLSLLGAFYNEALLFRRFFSPEQLNCIDTLLEEFKQGSTKSKRDQVIDDIESYIKENHFIIFLYHPIKTRFFDPMIKDIQLDSFSQINLRKLWINPYSRNKDI